MPRISEQILIPHSADNLYELVRDVRLYPTFIKWIDRLDVSQESHEGDLYHSLADVTVKFKGFEERFSTRVSGNAATRQVDAILHRGPFVRLKNRWQLTPKNDHQTRVHFFLDYAFENPVLRLLAKTNSRIATNKIISAFQAEADRRHGRPAERPPA